MAKPKNKKDKSSKKSSRAKAPQKREPEINPGSTQDAPAGKKEKAIQKAAPRTEKQPCGTASKERGVQISTCMAGMFLTLCLGLYLGSLLPDMLVPHASHPVDTQQQAALPAPAIPEQSSPKMAEPEQSASKNSELAISSKLKQHIEHLERESSQNPQDAKLFADLGNAYFDTGQTQKAISAYEKSLALQPNDPDVLTDLGIMFREEKKYDKALECFRKAAALNPAHINALFNEGVVLGMDQHKHAEAKAVWERVLRLAPDARTPDGRKVSELIRMLEGDQPH